MHNDPTRDPSFIAQSEGRTAQDCGMKWLAEWHHGVRPSTPESPPQRIGTIGHAIIGEHMLAMYDGRPPGPTAAVRAECVRRGYQRGEPDDFYPEFEEEVRRAESAAEALIESPKFNPGVALVMNGRPMIEQRLKVQWRELAAFGGLDIGMLAGIFHGYRLGMEGQPDIAHVHPSVIYIDDYKLRQKADLGGAQAESTLPDSQGAFYKVLLRGAGLPAHLRHHDLVFRQLNTYAGPWLTLEDFLREGSEYVTSHGIPSRDLKVLGMVSAEVWEEAWRALVERRRVASAHATRTTGKGKVVPAQVRLASPAETRDAQNFIATLRATPLVEVSEFRLDHTVCVEVVRDMLAAVAGHIALLRAGTTPGRHLRTYPNAPCSRRYGCPVQEPCLAALGTGDIAATLAEMAEDGRLRRDLDRARTLTISDYDNTETNP